MPVARRTITMMKPYGSIRAKPAAIECGSRLTAMRPPSRGGIGKRFNAISMRLIWMPAPAISMKPSLASGPPGEAALSRNPHTIAIAKLAPGPAPATQNMSRFGLRRLAKVHRHRFRPSEDETGTAELREQEQTPRDQDRSDRVDVLYRVRRDPTQHPRGLVAEKLGDVTVRRLVQRDREDHRHRPEHDGRQRNIHWPLVYSKTMAASG
jgi:hypothetical protein